MPMLLSPEEVGSLYNLHRSLMFFVNQRLRVLPDCPANPDEYSSLPPSTRLKVHDALFTHMDLIQSFVDETPAHLSHDDLGIILSWRHLVHGKFFVFRELNQHTVFLSTEKPPVAYGVMALSPSQSSRHARRTIPPTLCRSSLVWSTSSAVRI